MEQARKGKRNGKQTTRSRGGKTNAGSKRDGKNSSGGRNHNGGRSTRPGGKTDQKGTPRKEPEKGRKKPSTEPDSSKAQQYHIGLLSHLIKRPLPPDNQHKMRKIVLSALNFPSDEEVVSLLATPAGLSSLQTIASTHFSTDAGDRRDRHSFQTIAVPFCHLLHTRVATSTNLDRVMSIFSELCRGGASFFSLEEGSAISCLLDCAESPEYISRGAGRNDSTKYVPSTLKEMFNDILEAMRQLFVNVKEESNQEKWPEIVEQLEPYVPDDCIGKFSRVSSLVMSNRAQQKKTKELVERAQSHQLPSIVATASFPGALCPTGARHNNDYENYRKIIALPTAEEMLSSQAPYLPKQYLLYDGDHRGSEFLVSDIDRHLDIQFRLLREDMVRTLRCGSQLIAERGGLGSLPPGKYRHRLTAKDHSSIVHCAIMRKVKIIGFRPSFRVPLCFTVRFEHPSPGDKKFWDPKVCRLLRKGQLVSLLLNSSTQESLTATVSGFVEYDRPKTGGNHWCSVELELVSGSPSNILLVLEHAGEQAHEIGLMEIGGVQIFAYKPVLRALQLQTAGGVPFLSRLVPTGGQPECCTEVLPAFITASTRFDLSCLVGDGLAVPRELQSVGIQSFDQLARLLTSPKIESALRMDRTQALAFSAALTRDISLIQGPPGTGKTFVGVEILQALLLNSKGFPSTEWKDAMPPCETEDGKPLLDPIMCITFTNHALDQLLEHLLSNRIVTAGEIVRLGSRTKSEKLSSCTMFEREKAEWTKSDGFKKFELKREAEQIIGEIGRAIEILESRPNGKQWSEHVIAVLSEEDEDLLDRMQIRLKEEEKNGYQDLGTGPLAMLRKYSKELYEDLQQLSYELLIESTSRNLQSLQKISEDIERVSTAVKLRVAKKARVIGMTTTGCSMHSQLIKALRPKVIMCEEAGEVLESHLLSALTERTQALILIGDHLQLRPKPAEYELSVESKKGYDLDVSLFERLVKSRTPSELLHEQWRMRPEISFLLRSTLYHQLKDHPSVKRHPPLKGFAQSILFLDHDHAEAGSSEGTSKSNKFEADMVTAIVEYAVRNGYQGERVAVLTPYLGQLRLIRGSLAARRMTVFVDERTEEELLEDELKSVTEEHLDSRAAPNADSFSVEKLRDCVRLSTVDNFQGEEADLVIISSVRCNREGHVGFLATDNRVNVMLSRARHGMVMLGSKKTVLRKEGRQPTMFQSVLRLLDEQGAVVRALPLVCEKHPEEVTEAASPAEVPLHGGCKRQCISRLECGHRCRSLCHPDNAQHLSIHCRENCTKQLACGHYCKQLCRDKCRCSEKVTFPLPCGHEIRVSCQRALSFRANPSANNIHCTIEVDVPADRKQLPCGHVLEKVRCHELQAGSLMCVSECGASPWECGHKCTRQCSECMVRGQAPHHGLCSHPCGRTLLCGHVCTASPCHDANSCPPCRERCAIRCEHSACEKPCPESCSPCVEPCQWKCTVEHENRHSCRLKCASACTRPPCDVRCRRELRCGHLCPSLCGEVCPEGACPSCAAEGRVPKELADSVVDFYLFTTLKEHVVDDDDPGTCLLQLRCGHVFTAQYLDGKTNLKSFYQQNDGIWGHSKPLCSDALSDKHIDRCDHCPAPLLGPRRYSRCIKSREMHLLDVKWSHGCRLKLSEIERDASTIPEGPGSRKAFDAVKKKANAFLAMAQRKRASPMEMCIPLAEEVPQGAQNRAAVARAQAFAASCLVCGLSIKRQLDNLESVKKAPKQKEEQSSELHANALQLAKKMEGSYTEGLRFAVTGCSSTTKATLNLFYAQGLCHAIKLLAKLYETEPHEPSREAMGKFVKKLESIMEQDKGVQARFADVLPLLRVRMEATRDLTATEKKLIFEAMSQDVGSGVGSFGGHWFECPNGHPYAIGECGGAVQLSKCIECGAEIGGRGHRLRNDNKVAKEFLSEVGDHRPRNIHPTPFF